MNSTTQEQDYAIAQMISDVIDRRVTSDFLNANQNNKTFTDEETERLKEQAKRELMEKIELFNLYGPRNTGIGALSMFRDASNKPQ